MSELMLFEAEVLTLTHEETTERQILENGIREGLLIAWKNLELIRDKRLYRSTHKTFEEYCREVWGLAKSMAHYQIAASKVVENLSTNSGQNILPTAETQCRPLAPLPPAQQVEVWEKAVEIAPDKKPTARDVEIAKGIVQTEKERFKAIATSAKSDEHYTPGDIVEAVLDCFDGLLSLDPCSNSHDAPNLPASTLYTIDDDGLKQAWRASTVYINPPYSETSPWVKKLLTHYQAGEVGQALVLVKSDNRVGWYAELMDSATAFCEYRGYIKFGDASGSAPFASTIFYFGQEVDRFYRAFSPLGWVCQVINPELFGE
jgi:hypothetical protein